MPIEELTVIIAARDAAGTIGRAVASALEAGAGEVLLVDDYSRDDTARVALEVAGSGRLRTVRPKEKRGLGNARQTGLEAVETPYLMWLDADDALLPGRIERMLLELRSGADLVFDAAELRDGQSGALRRVLEMPPFLADKHGDLRLFERNYLPGPAWPGARTAFARSVGFDRDLPTADDLDFNLRSLLAGGRMGFQDSVGYCQFAYKSSLSRNIGLQKSSAGRALAKHDLVGIEAFLKGRGMPESLVGWTLFSMALFRQELERAEDFMAMAFPLGMDSEEVFDQGGAYPVKSGWLEGFSRGTLDLLRGGTDADGWLERALRFESSAEVCNNRGVGLMRGGEPEAARRYFVEALRLFPGYLDAFRNLEAGSGRGWVTSHPLRRHASRSEYK